MYKLREVWRLINSTKKRILYCVYHPTLLKEESELFWEAGFEILVPKNLMGHSLVYDLENKSYANHLQRCRDRCSLPIEIQNQFNEMNLTDLSLDISGADIDLLNKNIDILYMYPSTAHALRILELGYSGLILYRY